MTGRHWVEDALAELEARPDVVVLNRTVAFGHYDHGLVMATQRMSARGKATASRERLWQIRARRVILATGAHEQPLLFSNNDTPGVMLASAAQTYAGRFGALVGRRVLIATETDSRTEERRVGKGCVRTGRSGWSPV